MWNFVFLCAAVCFWSVSTERNDINVVKVFEKDHESGFASSEVEFRLKRDLTARVPATDRSVVIHKEGEAYKSPADIFWKDNSETARLRQLRPGEVQPTITRVIHHGIYPSLEVSEPIRPVNTSRFKTRTKRDWFNKSKSDNKGSGSTITNFSYQETGTSSGTFHQESTFQVKEGPRTVVDRHNSQDSSVQTAYFAQYPSRSNSTPQNIPNNNSGNPSTPKYNSRVQPTSRKNGQWVRSTTPGSTKFLRAKRDFGSGNDHYRSESFGNEQTHQRSSGTTYRRWDSQDGTVKTTYQAQYPPYNSTRNISHYARAHHPSNMSVNYTSFYTSQFVRPTTNRTNSSSKYRTLYYPDGNSLDNKNYSGDTKNKGNVRLISVGYYAVNESTDGIRSYSNPPGRGRMMGLSESPRTNNFEPSRFKRDAGSWAWFDKLMVSIGLAKFENTKKANPLESETVKLEVEDTGNEVLQTQYGYSTNGHHHVAPSEVDRIYLVGTASPQTTTSPPHHAAALTAEDPADYDGELITSEELRELLASTTPPPEDLRKSANNRKDLPKTGEVLIQAPPRNIICEPPLRAARGRCRRVYRSKP